VERREERSSVAEVVTLESAGLSVDNPASTRLVQAALNAGKPIFYSPWHMLRSLIYSPPSSLKSLLLQSPTSHSPLGPPNTKFHLQLVLLLPQMRLGIIGHYKPRS